MLHLANNNIIKKSMIFKLTSADLIEWTSAPHSPRCLRPVSRSRCASTAMQRLFQQTHLLVLFDMLHTGNPLLIPHVSFRSILPKDWEADPLLQGLHPGDETWAVPHPNRRFPLHNRGDSGKCKCIPEALLRRDSQRYRKQASSGFWRSMLIGSVEKSTYWKLTL